MAAGGALIGFLLAVLGAGGSILLLPLLISGAGLPTREAVPLSLLAVTLLAVANAGPYLPRRQVAPRPALILGVPALAGSWIGGSLVRQGLVPEPVQLAVFAAAALVAAGLLLRRQQGPGGSRRPIESRRPGRPLALAGQGLVVGLLTGIAGVGGGFAIVPALVLIAGLPMSLASGTSLVLIATNSLVALGALGHWPAAGLPLLAPLIGGGLVGAIGGQALAPHLSDRRLRQGFAALLVGSALLTGAEALQRQRHLSSAIPSPPTVPQQR
ncbi:sulfite exporter TauE/SafE family protein [Cyanobium sp. N.Huapi 1H5]|uniref:sulfite exporter TauE/SafE family protein n=1 Tax=Cyanobium sp. N.Huapi 1H5 TaxID=2823719 RepID=UPI0020CC8BFC|nr:sulfite exporter TauE/SafE family protein [Cyanobium sp. N.Huapi 1H5]